MSPMTEADKRRIMSTQAKAGHDMSSADFASRAQSAADRNAAAAALRAEADFYRNANTAAMSGANEFSSGGPSSSWWQTVLTALFVAAGVAWLGRR